MKLKKLSDTTHQRLLGWKPEPISARAKKQIKDTWAEFGLENAVDRSELVELELPEWLQTYDKVAEAAVNRYGKRSLARLNKFSRMDTPDLPPVKPPRVNGWQRWSLTDKCNWQMSGSPKSGSAMVLDFETVEVSEGRWMPICCVVLTDEFWYVWQADINDLQPLLDFSKDQVIVAHNAGYDRSFLKPEYYYQESGNMFFDTMAAWIATRGFCNQQRIIYATSEEDSAPGWVNETATNGLDAVYEFYTGGKLDKGVRDLIVNQGIPWLRQPGSLQEVTWYCIKDVLATFEVFRYVYPEWRNSQPSEVSQTAQLLLGNTWLPLSGDRYPEYYDRAEAKYNEVLTNVQQRINQLCMEVLNKPTQVQLEQLDWTLAKTGKTKGLPKWLRDCKGKPKVTERVAPILLSCTWRGKPILWDDELGWHTSDGALPHPEKQGKKVTSLFVKGMETAVEQGVLDAPGGLKDLLQSLMSTINWKSLRDRVKAMKVENLEGFPVCLPRMNVTGTVTRRCADNMWQIASNPKPKRIGTELKSLVEAPDGYTFVGADVSSQELWIAASLGDAQLGYCGSTALGLMTLIGVKADKTDPHSVVAAKVGISRDLAKNILYGLVYGLGLKGVTDYIAKSNPLMHRSECEAMAKTLLNLVKGYKSKHTNSFVGGLGSESFNVMDEIADSDSPTTPILKARMSKALAGQEDFKTTRTNWTIQSSGADFRDLLVLYTRYCFEQLGVRGRLLLTIHDEIRTIVVTEDANKAAYALQLAHLLTRAYFTDALGLDCIPAGVAWFPEIDTDLFLRKDPFADQITPSQPEALPPGSVFAPSDLKEYLSKNLVAT